MAVTDVRALRHKLALTQREFADQFGLNIWDVRNWEQGRREPDMPARTLLRVIDRNPDLVRAALATTSLAHKEE